ncbi:uncharacterized protein vgf [Mustelus asterias]
MVWPSGSQALSLFVLTLAGLTLSGAVPLTEGENSERPHPANPKGSEQPTRSQDPGASPGDGETARGETETAKSHQVRAAASGEEVFTDADTKTLAAILLQALKVDEDKPTGGEGGPRWRGEGVVDRGPTAAQGEDWTEDVKSRSWVGKTQRSPSAQESQDSEWREEEDQEDTWTPQGTERLEAMLRGMGKHSAAQPPPALRDQAAQGDAWRDLDELVGRKEKDSEGREDGARGWVKHRGEDGEAREGGRRKSGQQKAADRASDLLLQYLLRGEASEEEEGEEEEEGRSSEESASEEKRAEEEEEGEDIDPQTIDRLIEISSKLHLPADDVIDIITEVEKKRKDPAESRHGGPSRDRFKAPAPRPVSSSNHPGRPRPEKGRHRAHTHLSLQDLLGAGNALDYESAPHLAAPRRYRPRPNPYPNYIRPRVYQQRHRPYYYQPPAPVYRDKDYYEDETQDTEEELENYIEKILLKHPEVFQ